LNNVTAAAPQSQPMSPVAAKTARSWIAVCLLFAIIYMGSAFSPSLQDDADSSHAEAAREMFVNHDYVTLHMNGVRYLEKAPFMYWMVAGAYHIFGVNEFATHLPIVVAMLLLVLLAMRWASHAFGERAGVYAGLFAATTVGYYLFTRILIPEAILSLFIAASFYCFATAMEERSRPWRWYAGYACLALAVLTKGLLALVVVGGASFAYLAISGEWRRWREFRLGTGLLLFFVIAAPWHILAGIRNPRFFWFYFVNEHFLRFLGERYPVDYNKLPATLYWSLHLVWLFPWSLYLPVAVRRILSDYKQRGGGASARSFRNRTELVCLLWATVMLGFFAFSTNQEYYTMPAYLPLIILLASAVAQEEETGKNRWLGVTSAVLAIASLAASGVLVAGLWASRKLPFVPDIGTVLAKPNLKDDTLSMGHILDLTGNSFAALRLPAILAAIALAIGPVVAFYLRKRARHFAATWATAMTMAVFLLAAHIALVRFDPYLSSKNLAEVIARESKPGDRVMIYGDQAFGSSLLFYLRRPIELVNGRTTSMWFGSTYPDCPDIYRDDAQLVQAWKSPQRIFLFVPEYEQKRVASVLQLPQYVVAESSGKTVYTNRP
jgi:4-amino-4-deoxy-L-arabinose transferase-like glycosyltransferase